MVNLKFFLRTFYAVVVAKVSCYKIWASMGI